MDIQGGTAPSQTSNVVKVNPTTLKVQELSYRNQGQFRRLHRPEADGRSL
jgi:hypothetical protein